MLTKETEPNISNKAKREIQGLSNSKTYESFRYKCVKNNHFYWTIGEVWNIKQQTISKVLEIIEEHEKYNVINDYKSLIKRIKKLKEGKR